MSSSTLSAFSSTLGNTTAASTSHDSIDRSLLPHSSGLHYDFPSSSSTNSANNKTINSKTNYLHDKQQQQQQCRYFPINKHEFLPNYSNFVSDSVSPRSASSSSTFNDITLSGAQHSHAAHHLNSYHQQNLSDLPSPSSSTASSSSHKANNPISSPLFGPYSQNPFAPLLPTYETAALPSPTIYPPTPPPSAWNPFF